MILKSLKIHFLTVIVQHESDSEYFKFELYRTHEHERRLIRVRFDSSQKNIIIINCEKFEPV